MRILKWFSGTVLVLVVVLALTVVFGLNSLKGPITRAVSKATDRELVIQRLTPVWSWTHPRFRAEGVSFANAKWGKAEYLLKADAIEATVSVLPLLIGRIVLPEVHLEKGDISLEQNAEGKKNWVMKDDPEPKQESRINIHLLTLDHARLAYEDGMRDINVRTELMTDAEGVGFSVQGKYNGMPLKGSGHGGPVLSIRDEELPYPIKAQAKIGETSINLEGTITGIVGLQKLDLKFQPLSGKSLDDLYHIVNVAFPATSRYTTTGRLVRDGTNIRYEKFTAKIGESDLAGSLEVDTGGKRTRMTGDITAKVLNIVDLGPLVGTGKPGQKAGVLPDAPFDSSRWESVDADVKIHAGTIKRPQQLPLERLNTRIVMKDSVLSLDPLEFGIAGGKLAGIVRMDGKQEPIKSDMRMGITDLKLGELFPTVEKAKTSIGDISGVIELTGSGDSVAKMLGSANGKIGVFMDGGKVSKFLMNAVAIDIWGLAKTKLEGDEPVEIRCAIADFGVKNGVAKANALVFDTQVVNVGGDGTINLKDEQMDLTLKPEPKDKSVASLNSPLLIRGTFSEPKVGVDMKRLAARGVGAVAMGVLNPVLAILPLLNRGEGKDSNCAQLITAATSSGQSAAAGGTKKRPPSQPVR
ncbi:MAG TPA: AsmA family protein [Burkholderiales bacterium]|nr:AsmA family protein [Burkholderiales bacterium]